MKTMNQFAAVLGVVGVLALPACGTMNPFDTSGSGTGSSGSINAGKAYSGTGVVQSIDLVRQANTGKDIHRFTIRMDSGTRQTVTNATNAGFSVGDRVRIDNGSMQRI